MRDNEEVPEGLPAAVRDLSSSVWELAASYDAPQHAEPARRLAVQAAAGAAAISPRRAAPTSCSCAGQVRSAAADLVRAAELVTGDDEALENRHTEELLVAPAVA